MGTKAPPVVFAARQYSNSSSGLSSSILSRHSRRNHGGVHPSRLNVTTPADKQKNIFPGTTGEQHSELNHDHEVAFIHTRCNNPALANTTFLEYSGSSACHRFQLSVREACVLQVEGNTIWVLCSAVIMFEVSLHTIPLGRGQGEIRVYATSMHCYQLNLCKNSPCTVSRSMSSWAGGGATQPVAGA